MRKLASVQTISQISPIPTADHVVMAMVLGYETVVKKTDFKVGDQCVYIECDSLCPERPEFAFLESVRYRIKIRRFKGQYSYGLVMPTSILPKGVYNEGADVTEFLGIKNYVKIREDAEELENVQTITTKSRSPVLRFLMKNSTFRKVYLKLNRVDKGNWPEWISKTDEERLQNCTSVLINHFDEPWYITEKEDGSSTTLFKHKTLSWGFNKYVFGVCSRNVWLKSPDNSEFWKIVKSNNLEKKFKTLLGKNEIVLQGECLSPKIQGNKYKLTEPDIYIFNYVINGVRQSLDSLKDMCYTLKLKPVPILSTSFIPSEHMKSKDVKDVMHYMLEMSRGKSKLYDTDREGIVCRLCSNPHISFKVINPDFMMKEVDKT